MNKHLQSILSFIEQDKRLSAEEKNAILKSLEDADKELEITTFKLDRTEKVKLATAILLEETIEELEQKRKAVEAQVRESKIEAGLEKVRSTAMAMQTSEELNALIGTVFVELTKLDLVLTRCVIMIYENAEKGVRWWMANSEVPNKPMNYYVQYNDLAFFNNYYNEWNKRTFKWKYVLEGQDKLDLDDFIFSETELSQLPVFVINSMRAPERVYLNVSFNNFGDLTLASLVPLSEEHFDILLRFAKVFDLTYTRFNDLQKAEASAKEAIKQAALDRIRANIASMRTIADLDRITPLIWNELTIIGVPFIRCGVFIMDEDQKLIHTFLSTPDGKAIGAFHLPYATQSNIRKVLVHWYEKKSYIDHWDESAFTEFADILVKQGTLASQEQYLKTIPHGGFYLHFLPFLQGMLYVGNTIQLSDDEIELIQSLADAFSTAYARYEDFNKLEVAKKQVDSTLNELQVTQKQLIQSEKMASLGELTAGIAHEIQNPLNFVNNFSEVTSELLDEMIAELLNNNKEDAIAIADDVRKNLEKILHHGKRADGIVKGMLQHSRSSSGVKEPTDINKLADEYLRLAYHGLRAKDKSSNADLKTDYDETIGNIDIIPQDMGRAVLNLITNAFYAVTERKNQQSEGFKPLVSVSTKKVNNHVEIRVRDNGNGISQKVVDKIFQPFFTTKPTGQGTGLGLSLSYDIIKAHGGEVKVKTKEGEGSEFIIEVPIKINI
jgi:signal transduction histidine kinase